MKRLAVLATGLLLSSACDEATQMLEAAQNAAEGPARIDVDYTMFDNDAELDKLHALIAEGLGDNAAQAYEIRVSMRRQADQTVQRQGDPDEYSVSVSYKAGKGKSTVATRSWSSGSPQWGNPSMAEVVPVRNPERFNLEKHLFDFARVTPEFLRETVAKARSRHYKDEKYTVQYVDDIDIDADKLQVTVRMRLKSNDQLTYKMHKAKLPKT